MVSRARSLTLIVLSWVVLAPAARAQTYLAWNGLGADGNWTTGANWEGAAAPANNGTALVRFGVSNRTVVTVDTAQNVAGLKFEFPATNDLTYRLGGNATSLTLGAGGIITNNAYPVVSPAAAGTINGSTPGAVTFEAALGLVLGANQTWSLAAGTAVLANGTISGSGTLSLEGSGHVALNGSNSHSGGTILGGGTLAVGHDQALGTGSFTVSGPARIFSGAPIRTLANTLLLNASALLLEAYGGEVRFTGPVTLGANTTLTTSSALAVVAGPISETGGARSLTIAGLHALDGFVLSGRNTYTGGTTLQGGRLVLDHIAALGSGPLTVVQGTLNAIPRIETFLASVPTFANPLVVRSAFEAGGANAFTWSGPVANGANSTGLIRKRGDSNLTFSGNNTAFSGGFHIAEGTLTFASSTAAGTGTVTLDGSTAVLNVASGVVLANPIAFGPGGGVLAGKGSFSNRVTLGANSGLAPGSGVGALTFTGGLTWGPGARYEVEVQNAAGTPGVGWDTTLVSGPLSFTATLGSPFTIFLRSLDGTGQPGNALNFDPYRAYSWTILSANSLPGFGAAAVTLDTSGFLSPVNGGQFKLDANGGTLAVTFTPVPEPETWALLVIGLGAAAWTRLRRRRG